MSDLSRGDHPPIQPEEHEKPKRLFVDVGCGSFPVVDVGSKKFGGEEIYLGLDLNSEKIDELSKKHKDNPSVQFKRAEGDQDEFYFPLPDGAADTVHIGNVFGIPGGVDSHNLQLLLEESIRILREGGTLSVLETLTPNYSRDDFEGILRLHHLKITVSISPQSSQWRQTIAEYYDNTHTDWNPEKGWNRFCYLIKAEKQPSVG